MEEPRPMVCYWRGVMDSLVDKLTEVKKMHPKVDPLLQDLESHREDLINKFDRGRETHKQVKGWMKQNRQLVYDIEDWIDLKLGANWDESESDLEEQVDEFKAKIKEARDRWERYDLARKAAISDAKVAIDVVPHKKVAVDSQLLWEKNGILVGIDGPRKKLEEHLKDTEKKRKVVSVLGKGGLGKTTLAAKVYEDLNRPFDCHASVTVGLNSSITTLMDVFLQVNPDMVAHDTRPSLNEQEVIRQLWEFLKDKRYFIFVDDIRNTRSWSIINCALPNNELRSRILITTRVKDLATFCSVRPTDVVYKMKGLDEGDSKRLLLTAISAKAENSSANFKNKCDAMLNKCRGLPLAIIVTAGLLASTKLAGLGPLGKPEESDEMRTVMDICFSDLAPPVKACFLYLSTFPENYTIQKDRLIRRWSAEGFIPKTSQESLLETGQSYFNELICRNLIRPVFDDYNDDQPVVCTVHPVIHDFIVSDSRQEDFHTAAAELILSGPFPYGTIRRFSVDCRQKGNEAYILESSAIHLSSLRSLTVFGDADRVLDLSTYKHLRVLDLEDTKSLDNQQVESIGFLLLLKYLGLRGANVTKLPERIMSLEHLSTLDLRRTEVRELPAFGNKKLVSLLAPILIIPRGMGGMEELEELSAVLFGRDTLLNLEGSHAVDVVELVRKSRRLRMLGIKLGYLADTEGVKQFLEEVRKSNLQSLSLDGYPLSSVDLLVDVWDHERSHCLHKLELKMSGCLPLVPEKMASVIAVTHLHIQVKVLQAKGVRALGKLPYLILLKLFSEEGTQESLRISSKDGFRCLKIFWFRSPYFLGMGLQFEAGAMPQLQRLQIEFNARKTKSGDIKFDFGIQHLCDLLQVRAIIRCKDVTDSEAKAVEAAIRGQVEATKEADSSKTSTVDIRISILPEPTSFLPLPGPVSSVTEDAMVSASTGAMNSVLTKLATLMGEQYAELTGAGGMELILIDELQVMNARLKQLSDKADLNKQMKESRNQMRGLTYNIEDSIDDLLLRSVNEEVCSSTEKRIMPRDDLIVHSVGEKDTGSADKSVMPHDFIDQIQNLNAQVEKEDLRSMVSKTEIRSFGPCQMAREEWLFNVYDQVDGPMSALKEVHEQIVEACQGMPLAITLIAGLLASKPVETEHWSTVEKQLKSVQGNHFSVEWMRKVFEISYSDLSSDMKTCLLYLSSFPANCLIRKDRLIRRWAAEGFLPKQSVETWWQTGESYFLELIARKLIEPIYEDADSTFNFTFPEMNADGGLPTGCKVGYSVHDFITSLSSEENFVKQGYVSEKGSPRDWMYDDGIPRQYGVFSRDPRQDGVFLRILGTDYIYEELCDLEDMFELESSKVRSLTFEHSIRMPDISAFKHVRVLDLEDVKCLDEEVWRSVHSQNKGLRSVGHLSLLRYLGLAGTGIMDLPQEITALEHLETVDLRRNELFRGSPEIFKSTKLVSLIADSFKLPTGMEETQQVLEELFKVRVGNDGGRLAKVVSQSKRLRRLAVSIDGGAKSETGTEGLMNLLAVIGNSYIRSLRLEDDYYNSHPDLLGILLNCWAQKRPCYLEKLQLILYRARPEVPRDMLLSLSDLTHLRISVRRVDTEGLRILGNLPNLVSLHLIPYLVTERLVSKNSFRCLRVFWCECISQCSSWMGLQFEAGSMPQLRRLDLKFFAEEIESDFGIQFLPCLVHVHATISCYGKASTVEALEAAMRDQVSRNPNNPVLEITRRSEEFMVRDTT